MGLFSRKPPSRIKQIAEAMASTAMESAQGTTLQVVKALNENTVFTDKYEFNEHNLLAVRLTIASEMILHIQSSFSAGLEKSEIVDESWAAFIRIGNWNKDFFKKLFFTNFGARAQAKHVGKTDEQITHDCLLSLMMCKGQRDNRRAEDVDTITKVSVLIKTQAGAWELYKNGLL